MTSASSPAVPASTSVRSAGDQGSSSLSDYGSALLRRWWLVLLGLVIGAAAAGGYLSAVAKVYTSTAAVQVTDTGANDSALPAGSRNTSNIDMDTEAQVVTSNTVATLAAGELHTKTPPPDLSKNVKVTVPPNSAVLSIAYSASNARDARAGAQAFADSYLANRTDVAKGLISSELKNLQGQLPALDKQLQNLTGQVAALPSNDPRRAYAVAQQTIVGNQIDTINSAINPLLQQGVTPGRLISPAVVPSKASSPQVPIVLLSGGLGGLLLGALLALLAVRRDRRIHRSSEFVHTVGLPLLADLPNSGLKGAGLLPPDSGAGAAIREVRDRLVGSGLERSILMVPISAAAGGSLVAVNLASSLAADGSSCALICASPDSVSPLRLRLAEGAGLSDALTYGFTDVRSTLVHSKDRRFGVVLPGRQPAALLDRLHGAAMRDMVRDLREAYDHVVIEAPVWSSNRSALILGRTCDVVILVAETRMTTREEIIEAYEMLTSGGSTVLGVVLVPHLRGTGLSADATRSSREAAKSVPDTETDGASVVAGSAGSSPTVR